MENIAASTASATVTDYRRKVDGKDNPNYGKDVKVNYDIPAFQVVSTFEEVTDKFSKEQLIAMAASRQKATANSAARQKAVNEYAATGDDAARESMIKSFMALRESAGKPVTREDAESHIDALMA